MITFHNTGFSESIKRKKNPITKMLNSNFLWNSIGIAKLLFSNLSLERFCYLMIF